MAKFPDNRRKRGLNVTLAGDWDRWRIFANAWDGNLAKGSERAVKKALQIGLREIDGRIRAGNYEKLAALTRLGRRRDGYGKIPLLRTGGLIRSISTEIKDSFEGTIGVNRTEKGGANLAELLHDGATIKITQAMRRAFARKFGKLKARSTGKQSIRIPPRPFIKAVFEDPSFVSTVENTFFEELDRQMRF